MQGADLTWGVYFLQKSCVGNRSDMGIYFLQKSCVGSRSDVGIYFLQKPCVGRRSDVVYSLQISWIALTLLAMGCSPPFSMHTPKNPQPDVRIK